MKKLSIVFLVISLTSFFLFNISESTVDENGVLVEPFYFIPIGYFMLFISAVLYIFYKILNRN